ncbi:MAG TPA: alanine--tRNA ligase [Solirubrobacteraceae bacterium]|jgi:alanyl-tRNA synthetase
MTSDEIRERYLGFFEERGHKRIPSASLVPSAHDPSALLTVAGMHPLKPYFLGQEQPPAPRLTSCQKCFRTVDIGNVGNTARHLTFFEMLGNFSIGDYFKEEAVRFAWELSLEVFGFTREDIWVTVFEGDEELGLGPDEEAIELWQDMGVPGERIVRCPRSENFWQGGPTGPCGPCSELYLDRGVQFGSEDDLPGGENERFLEYWNLVFMQFNQQPANTLSELPARNIDTGLGLNRMAAILQDKPSVFETDQFQPLLDLGQELSGRAYGEDAGADRSLRILADHTRAMTFLVADGVVPSNEDRGYVLRRVMRRAIQHGRALDMPPGFLTRYADTVTELMGATYSELREQHEAIGKWLSSEEEGFGRTLAQGTKLLEDLIDKARQEGQEGIAAQDAFTLHDTFGFPFELTTELAAEYGLGVDDEGFERLMDKQRARARAAGGSVAGGEDARELARELAEGAGFQTHFTGYETDEQRTTVGALAQVNGSREDAENGGSSAAAGQAIAASQAVAAGGRLLLKLAESPFYAAGGGQVSDAGTVECLSGDCAARVEGVFRLGDDQALAVVVERGTLRPEEAVLARVDRSARRASERNHTATHLLHAALRARLGGHVRQAGSYVGPDKLRFDFSHSQAMSTQELRDVEDQVNAWIAQGDPVRPITTTLDEAKRLGAMALFGEKYGDVVRMVEVGEGEYSRELCGGTHVRSTAEIGAFRILAETSSAANVRRIEALTGAGAVELLREHDRLLQDIAATLRTRPEGAPEAVRERELERKRLEKERKSGGAGPSGVDIDVDALAQQAEELAGAQVLTAVLQLPDAKALMGVLDRVRGKLPEAAVVLGAAVDGRVHLVAGVAPALVQKGVKAGAIVKAAAEVAGGGGGGRDTVAQAGGRQPEKLAEALAAGRAAIEAALEGGAAAGGGEPGPSIPRSEGGAAAGGGEPGPSIPRSDG